MDYSVRTMKNIWVYFNDSATWVLKIIIALWLALSGVHVYIYAIAALTVFDTVCGIMAARKEGLPITSKKLRKGLLDKFLLYMLLLIAVFVLDILLKSVFAHSTYYFVFAICFLISTYEVVSIFEKINIIKPDIPFLSALIRIFKKMGDKTVEKLEEKVEDVVDKVVDVKDKIKEVKEEKGKDGQSDVGKD